MSTLTEIKAALPKLSEAELKQLAEDLDRLFRERKGTSIYQDAHGTLNEADLIVAADRAFQDYDKAEEDDANRKAR
ncbi:MAG TPA: hypothetical protein VL171_06400 [Verrucomicrobiae bacterium]|nr:hypothetical protein [Verrucomicrobiae bacterium]